MNPLEKILISGTLAAAPFIGLGCGDPYETKTPGEAPKASINYVNVPERGPLDGQITANVKPYNLRVATFIRVNGNWWPKPYWNRQLADVDGIGVFKTEFRTGGSDNSADAIYLAVVKKDYPAVKEGTYFNDLESLPQTSDSRVLGVKLIVKDTADERKWKDAPKKD